MNTTTRSLLEEWEQLKTEQPNIRIRNAAAILGCSELELVLTGLQTTTVGGHRKAILLKPAFQEILKEIETLGKVMALSRNEFVVHERKGVYLHPTLNNPHVGLFVGEDIDLRIFFSCWGTAVAVTEILKDKPRFSLQFFSKNGEAIHKIYLTSESHEAAFHALVAKFENEEQVSQIQLSNTADISTELPDNDIDVNGFRDGWVQLKDTHDFFGLLKKYKVSRLQALRLAPEGNYAVKVTQQSIPEMLRKAADSQTPIMVFVGNPGIIQIHTGPVKKLFEFEGWFNVMDPDFNLHIKMDGIAQCWVVRKQSVDGIVTALECFDSAGELIVQFFGKRKPGIPELEAWQQIISDIETTCAHV